MSERAQDRPLSEIAAQARKLANAGHPLFSDRGFPMRAAVLEDMAKRLGPTATLRGAAALKANQNAWTSVLGQIEHSLTIKPGASFVTEVNAQARGAKAFYDSMLDASVTRPKGYTQHVGKVPSYAGGPLIPVDRPYHNPASKIVAFMDDDAANIYAHEWAHALETADERALNRSFQFHEARTKGETEKSLKELTGSSGYGDEERAKPDKYWHPYQGKMYEGGGYREGTEMTAMGYQAMLDRTEITMQDQETTWFMLGQLAGR
jgi:hypothetical protein